VNLNLTRVIAGPAGRQAEGAGGPTLALELGLRLAKAIASRQASHPTITFGGVKSPM